MISSLLRRSWRFWRRPSRTTTKNSIATSNPIQFSAGSEHRLAVLKFCWIKYNLILQVAHRTSSTAADWANTFAKHNSGTYNNEWVVVDYKRFRRGYHHQKDYGIIQVVEQLPHFVVHADMSKELLESTYWPGYNTPCFPLSRFLYFWRWYLDTSLKSKEKVRCRKWLTSSVIGIREYFFSSWLKKRNGFSYDKTPRALIFARDHDSVVDMESMLKLMRFEVVPVSSEKQ